MSRCLKTYIFHLFFLSSIIFLSNLLSQSSNAAAVLTGVDGASNFVIGSVNQNNVAVLPEIFGGTGGADCSSSVSNSETCNSCLDGQVQVCNPKRIYPSLKLKISFVDEAAQGRTLVTETVTNQPLNLISGESTNLVITPSGGTHTAVITWGDLCAALDSNSGSGCSQSFSAKRIRIGVSTDGTTFSGTTQDVNIRLVDPSGAGDTVPDCETATRGICEFSAYPGDKKVYLEDISSAGNFPSDSNVRFKSFRVMYSTESFAAITPASAIENNTFRDISILDSSTNTDPELGSNTVTDLSNDTLYFFRGLLVDEAGNLMDVTDEATYTSHPNCAGNANDPPATPEDEFACPFTARPGEVVGLLKEDFNCFIATATTGSSVHPMVKDLRKFRDRFLLGSHTGIEFTKFYYEYGSKFSHYLHQYPVLKNFTKIILYPFWWMASLSVLFGTNLFVWFLVISLFVVSIFFLSKVKNSLNIVKNFLWVLVFIIVVGLIITPHSFAQMIVTPKQKNSLPASKYENNSNSEVQMAHPLAEKGLKRITSDKIYLYETIESPKEHSLAVKFGMYDPINLQNEDNTNFADIYERSSAPMILIDYEWKWFNVLGEWNFQVGTGIFFTQGNGVFANNNSLRAREKFTFFAIPITGNLIYKMHLYQRQWLIPFGGGGIGIMGFSEVRDDFSGPKFGGSVVAPVFAGLALSVNSVSPETGRTLDREYGINKTLFAIEYRQFLSITDKYDFSADLINAGLMLEY